MTDITQKIKDEFSTKLVKRFFKNVTIEKTNSNSNKSSSTYIIQLDGRVIKTPMGNSLHIPNINLAKLVKNEWEIIDDSFNPSTLYYTKIINTIVDLNDEKRKLIYDEISDYISSDLLYYHANEDEGLISQQENIWGGILNKFSQKFKVSFKTTTNISFIEQEKNTIIKLSALIDNLDDYNLVLTHSITKLSGSAVIALALIFHVIDSKTAFDAIILEDIWQEKKWGKDDELTQIINIKNQEFSAITNILSYL